MVKIFRAGWRWLLRSVLILALGIALLIGLELVLRVTGYGKSTQPFVSCTVDGQSYFRQNLAFYGQFFGFSPTIMADWYEFECAIPKVKAPNAIRVFAFGGSSMHGGHDIARSIPQVLRAMLQDAYPDKNIELYVMAFPAASSHIMRALAQACAELQPDLFVVYMGHNEFVGPFGNVAAQARWLLEPRWIAMTSIALSDVRVLQMTQNLLHRFVPATNSSSDIRTSGLFARWLQLKTSQNAEDAVYACYRENLRDICRAGRHAGANVVLCTPTSNIRNWLPTASAHKADLSEAGTQHWQALMDKGNACRDAGDWAAAKDFFSQANALDAQYALLQFRLAECHWALGDYATARECFIKARDLDQSHIRSNTPLLNIVRETVQEFQGQGVLLADTVRTFEKESPHEVPGWELYVDCIHPSVYGSYLIGRTVFEALQEKPEGMPDRKNLPAPRNPALSFEDIRARLAVNALESYRTMLVETLSSNTEECASFLLEPPATVPFHQFDLLKSEIPTAPPLMDCYDRALALFARDRTLQYQYTIALLSAGFYPEALNQAHALEKEYPADRMTFLLTALALAGTGQDQEAITKLEAGRRACPNDVPFQLIQGWLQRAQTDKSLPLFQNALQNIARFPYPAIWYYLFDAVADTADLTDIEALFTQWIKTFPLMNEYGKGLAFFFERIDSALQRRFELDDQVAFWLRISQVSPDIGPLTQIYLARAYTRAGKEEDARKAYSVIVEFIRNDAENAWNSLQKQLEFANVFKTLQTKGDRLAAGLLLSCEKPWLTYSNFPAFNNRFTDPSGTFLSMETSPLDYATCLVIGKMLMDENANNASQFFFRMAAAMDASKTECRILLVESLVKDGQQAAAQTEAAQCGQLGIELPKSLLDALAAGSPPITAPPKQPAP